MTKLRLTRKSSHEELLNKFKCRNLKIAIQTQLVEYEYMEDRGKNIINITGKNQP